MPEIMAGVSELDTRVAGPTSEKVVVAPKKETGTSGSESEDQPPANDGPKVDRKAWLYVFAGFLILINAWGLAQTFGAFQEIYIRSLLPGTSPSALSWIGSVQVFFVIFLGAFTGPLFDAGYLRSLLASGCLLVVVGMATLSLAQTYWQVFLAQGVAVGIGSGLLYVPILAFTSTLLPSAVRPIGLGLVNSGGSTGGLIYTFALRDLVPRIGFAWATRAVALICLVVSILALAILLPYRPPPSQQGGTDKRRAVLDLKALREPSFLFFSFALLLNYVSFYIPPFYIATFATTALGQSREFGFEALAYASAASLVGRILPMLAAARLGSLQVYLFATLSMVAVLFSWMAVRDSGGLVAFCIFYGLASGVLVSGPSAAISHPILSPDMSVIGTRLGMLWMFGGFGALIGAPIAGALVDVSPGHVNFRPVQGFAGGIVGGAALCLIYPLIAVVRYDRSKKSSS